jgi:c-di-GMP-binding flagellar brake protein YcgR
MEQVTDSSFEEQYIVHNAKEITQILTDLSKRNEMLKVSFNDNRDVCLTTIIAVDIKSHAVHLDIGIDDAFNSRLLASHHVVFSKDDGIKIKWVSAHVSLVTLKDGKAIKIALPQKLLRLQRREFFRLTTPIVNPVPCQIPIAEAVSSDVERVLEFTLIDVSLGGIGIIVFGSLDETLVVGANFDQCKISFPDVGVTNLTLEVRHITVIPTQDNAIKHHIGLQYINPSRGNEGLINRYTHNLERLAMALSSKL